MEILACRKCELCDIEKHTILVKSRLLCWNSLGTLNHVLFVTKLNTTHHRHLVLQSAIESLICTGTTQEVSDSSSSTEATSN